MEEIKKVVEIVRELNGYSTEYSRLNWVQYTAGYDFGIQEAHNKFVNVMKNKENYKIILNHLEKNLSPANRRRVEIIEKRFRSYHLSPELTDLSNKIQKKSTELSQILNTHRSKLNGKEISSVELSRIMSQSPDRAKRKEAYLAKASVNKPLVDGGFIELLDMRKDYAELYGDKNFVEHSLKQSELDPAIFSSWRDELKAQLPAIEKQEKDFAHKYLELDELMPWDASYLSGKIAPELNKRVNMTEFFSPIQKLFNKFGIDISNDNTTYDIFPRKNKSEWGYNFPIEPGKESRILANVQNLYSQFKVLLHETGHAMHFFRLNPEDPLLNKGISGIISEGIANLFGGFLTEEIFFAEFFEDDLDAARKHFADYKKWGKVSALTAIESIMFDQDLYLTPIKTLDDINQLNWKTYSELLGKKPYADEPLWGFKIHHTTHPIYLHNYFMGDVTCEMLKAVFCKKHNITSILEKPELFGTFLLDEVIKPAGRYPYAELFKRISGEDFSLKFIKI